MEEPVKNISEQDKFTKWHSIDRNKIDWHPVIDESKCIGCGMCAASCGRGVYKFDYDKRKAIVADPNHCLVGCQTCANLCPVGAISFVKDPQTTREKAQKIIQETGVFANIKQELESKKDQLKTDNNKDR